MSEQRIQRYDIEPHRDRNLYGARVKQCDHGEFVTFADHSARVAELTEAKDRAERRLGESRAAFVEMGEMMAGMYQAAGEHEKARVLRQKLNELKDQPA